MDFKLELVLIPVSDVDRAKDFYTQAAGFGEFRHLDDDGRWKPDPDPQHRSYMSFAEFSDPDGNSWLLQEVHRPDATP
jgi:catechol 2,3-dioxygenase-like lactoylglutathione lyase family enzyme